MEDVNFRKGDAKTEVFGSNRMLQPSPVEKIPDGPTTPEIAYQMVKDETFAQTQPRLNLATFVTTYMDDYATKLMNEAININYIDETEYPRIAVMNGKCINIVANLWNSPEKDTWKTGALAIGSSEACMLGGVAAWLRWRKKRQAQGKPFDKPNFVISTGFQVVWEKFAQLWQIEMREVPLTLDKTTLDPEEALKMCDENTICIVPIQGVTWTGLNDDVEALVTETKQDTNFLVHLFVVNRKVHSRKADNVRNLLTRKQIGQFMLNLSQSNCLFHTFYNYRGLT